VELKVIAIPKILLEWGDRPVSWEFEGDLWGKCGEGWGDRLIKSLPEASKRQSIYRELLLISIMISPCCNLPNASVKVFERS
jgi:hypothetical protein